MYNARHWRSFTIRARLGLIFEPTSVSSSLFFCIIWTLWIIPREFFSLFLFRTSFWESDEPCQMGINHIRLVGVKIDGTHFIDAQFPVRIWSHLE